MFVVVFMLHQKQPQLNNYRAKYFSICCGLCPFPVLHGECSTTVTADKALTKWTPADSESLASQALFPKSVGAFFPFITIYSSKKSGMPQIKRQRFNQAMGALSKRKEITRSIYYSDGEKTAH